jgi:hypothetical protein
VQTPFRIVSWSSAISIRISLEDSEMRTDRRRTRSCGWRELSQTCSGLNIQERPYIERRRLRPPSLVQLLNQRAVIRRVLRPCLSSLGNEPVKSKTQKHSCDDHADECRITEGHVDRERCSSAPSRPSGVFIRARQFCPVGELSVTVLGVLVQSGNQPPGCQCRSLRSLSTNTLR